MHDGGELYPDVHKTLTEIKKAGKTVIFVSNAPRRAVRVASVLGELGIEPSLYRYIVSSGEVGFEWLAAGGCPCGKKYFMISAPKDVGLLDTLDFREVGELKNANFILNLGYGTEEQTTEDYLPILRSASDLALPMLCLNPDLEVIKISGEMYPCAGMLAKQYIALGGEVIYFGKPYSEIYEHAHQLLGGIPKNEILAVGDSLETDMAGAQRFGIDSALISGGILKSYSHDEIAKLCAERGLDPNYLLPQFGIK